MAQTTGLQMEADFATKAGKMVTSGVIFDWSPRIPYQDSNNNYGHNGFVEISLSRRTDLQDNSGVRCPHSRPQSDVTKGNFGDSDLGRCRIGIGVRSERCYVHLFGLLAQRLLVLEDGVDDEVIAKDDEAERDAVQEEEEAKAECLSLRVRRSTNQEYDQIILFAIFGK